ncbi:MAG: hypothetical protein LAE24_09980 [Candidatus Contendobacter sp.]|jgi:hypothetical protein|nr:hypothetical protein [Candidatus Contendobacter sp.]
MTATTLATLERRDLGDLDDLTPREDIDARDRVDTETGMTLLLDVDRLLDINAGFALDRLGSGSAIPRFGSVS